MLADQLARQNHDLDALIQQWAKADGPVHITYPNEEYAFFIPRFRAMRSRLMMRAQRIRQGSPYGTVHAFNVMPTEEITFGHLHDDDSPTIALKPIMYVFDQHVGMHVQGTNLREDDEMRAVARSLGIERVFKKSQYATLKQPTQPYICADILGMLTQQGKPAFVQAKSPVGYVRVTAQPLEEGVTNTMYKENIVMYRESPKHAQDIIALTHSARDFLCNTDS